MVPHEQILLLKPPSPHSGPHSGMCDGYVFSHVVYRVDLFIPSIFSVLAYNLFLLVISKQSTYIREI